MMVVDASVLPDNEFELFTALDRKFAMVLL